MSIVKKQPQVKLLHAGNKVRLMCSPTDWRPYTVIAEITLTPEQQEIFEAATFTFEKEQPRATTVLPKT